jgi:hypothetical protein
MRSIRRPLDAEMWASELLGMLELGAPADSTAQEREAVTLNLATRLVEHAIDQNSPSGLAVLRTLSVIGPQQSRTLARDAADRAAESGIRDRTWVATLGQPEVRRCWRFRDPDGAQDLCAGADAHTIADMRGLQGSVHALVTDGDPLADDAVVTDHGFAVHHNRAGMFYDEASSDPGRDADRDAAEHLGQLGQDQMQSSSNAWRLHARCASRPRSCCLTSRPPHWTPK